MIEPRLPGAADFAVAAERLGVDSVWTPEVWGYDALTGLGYRLAGKRVHPGPASWPRCSPQSLVWVGALPAGGPAIPPRISVMLVWR